MQLEQKPFEVSPEATATGSVVPVGSGKLNTNIGIETLNNTFTPIIQKETRLPCFKSQIFSTAYHNQAEISLNIFYGEPPKVVDSQHIGHFVISRIPPAPKGLPQIEIGFQVSTDGTFVLKARDLTKKAKIKLNRQTKV